MQPCKYPTAIVLVLACATSLCHLSRAYADPVKRIVLIAGVKSHGPGAHEYEKSVRLLKALLDRAPNLRGVETQIHFEGWPKDAAVLDRADVIAVISDGENTALPVPVRSPFMTEERMAVLRKQMERGCGLVTFHYSTFTPLKHAP